MTSRLRVASMMVTVAGLASACADEDLTGVRTDDPRDITVSGIGANAPTTTIVRLTPSTRPPRGGSLPVFYRMQVQAGNTVAIIAQRFGVRAEYITWNNEGVLRDGELVEGTRLAIPSANGILHEVQPGETLSEIATRYGVDLQAILDHPANASIGSTSLPATTVILVPDASRP